ncbi:hypothetical protein BKA63DRAFT_160219 [Paraphoma chrysanthemicola]|nr:hypothetical protein BKA63DRAFT_160219 [Paraphoma chrysanthemicola]
MDGVTRIENEAELDAILTTWEWEVVRYTRRQITKERDRLVALAGMASVVGRVVDCEFLAGLWKGRHFCRSLLWSVEDMAADEDADSPHTTGTRSLLNPLAGDAGEAENKTSYDDDMFPSWCWASCLSGARQITYGRWDEHMRAAAKTSRPPIESVNDLSYRVDDIFTQKRIQGTIEVRGRLRKMKAVINGSVETAANVARNFVKIIPEDEQLPDSLVTHPLSAEQDDYQLSESPPEQWIMPYNIVDGAAPKEWLGYLNNNLHDKHQKRSSAAKLEALSRDSGPSNLIGNDLMASLQNLEALKVQQESHQRTPVSIQDRQHFWIKDDFDSPDEKVWCLPIAFWDEVIVGLCLRPTTNENEFRRVGLCNIERSGQQTWEEDIVFDSWRTLELVSVSIV